MSTDTDILDFLEHHGVKGQKWGVRRERAAAAARAFGRGSVITGRAIGRGSAATARFAAPRIATGGRAVGRGAVTTAKFLKEHKKEVAIVVGVGAAIAGGILLRNRHVRLRDLDIQTRRAGVEGTARVLHAHRNVQITQLNKAHAAGRVNTEQGHRVAALIDRQLNNSMNRLIDQRTQGASNRDMTRDALRSAARDAGLPSRPQQPTESRAARLQSLAARVPRRR